MPLITVVIPVYNGADYVRLAVESVLYQTLSAFEIIVVDDGSTDETPKILKEFGSRITVLRKNNSGVGAARNSAIEVARGEYIAFLDADDVWHCDKLAAFSRTVLARPDGVLYFSDAMAIDCAGKKLRFIAANPRGAVTWENLLKENWVITSTAMVRRSVVPLAGFFRTDFKCPAGVEDWDFFLRIIRCGPAVYVPGAWSYYRQHVASAIQSHRHWLREDGLRAVALNTQGVPSLLKSRAEAMIWYQSGVRHLVAMDPVAARSDLRRSMRSRAFFTRSISLYSASFFGEYIVAFLLKCRRWFNQWRAGKREPISYDR